MCMNDVACQHPKKRASKTDQAAIGLMYCQNFAVYIFIRIMERNKTKSISAKRENRMTLNGAPAVH